jgi:hypothetical protein
MSKLLNRLKKITLVGVAGARPVGPSLYEPSIPHAALGVAGVAMTVITIAVSVILPAQVDSGRRESGVLVASKATLPASKGLVAVTSIVVVAAREPESSTVPVRIGDAAPRPGRLGKTTSPEIVRVSSAAQ